MIAAWRQISVWTNEREEDIVPLDRDDRGTNQGFTQNALEFRCKSKQGPSCKSNRDTGVFICMSHLRVKEHVLIFPSVCPSSTP